MSNKTPSKHTSIINRLHWHNRGQAVLSWLLFDLLLILVAVVTWALTLESTIDGTVIGRGLVWTNRPIHQASIDLSDPFAGLMYRISWENAMGETQSAVSFDASHIAMLLAYGLVILFFLQLLFGRLSSAADKHTIRRILRPIDDIAMNAERISQKSALSNPQRALFADSGEKESLASLASAIDNIDALSEDARISVQERELSGLEAAVNNMLRRLAQSQKEQIRFVDDASHELRTPIAVIQGYIGMLDRWGKDDPTVMEESITAIRQEAEHMQTLVEQLLFLARGESDRLELNMAPVDGGEILRELWEEYSMIDPDHQYTLSLPKPKKDPVENSPLSGEKVAISTGTAPEPAFPDAPEPDDTPEDPLSLWVQADTALLKQSLRTMLDNAKKFTPQNGTITLTGRPLPTEKAVSLEIADSGVGIPQEDLPRIFDRFWRGSSARSGVAGSGLGLSIARWIVERHGGRIDVASALGVGTKIGITLRQTEPMGTMVKE